MKTLLLLRHAKAQPDAPHGDKRRRLTERGVRDARAAGALVASLDVRPDAVISSDATRARQTAEFASAAPLVESRLYGADAETLLGIVRKLPDDAGCVLLVGHNPGMEELCSIVAEPATDVAHLPTAGLVHLDFDVERWRDIRPGAGTLRAVHVGRGS